MTVLISAAPRPASRGFSAGYIRPVGSRFTEAAIRLLPGRSYRLSPRFPPQALRRAGLGYRPTV